MKYPKLTIFVLLVVVITFLAISPAARPQQTDKLLPTGILAKQVQNLGLPVKGVTELQVRPKQGIAVREAISDFIVRQMETMPSIFAAQLEKQLRMVLCCGENNDCDNQPPYVYANDWGSRTTRRQVVVAYQLNLGFMGPGSTLITIESYLWEDQRVRRTSRGGSELDGRNVNFEMFASYPQTEEYWVLASGPMSGWSGRAFPGRAVLYRVGVNEVVSAWQSKTLPNLKAHRNELGWEMAYADPDRFYNNLPQPFVFDVYRFDYDDRKFRRVIHYRY